MTDNCKVCAGQFSDSPDSIVLCNFKEGPVHLGCCINNCSYDKKPCQHAIAAYERLDFR